MTQVPAAMDAVSALAQRYLAVRRCTERLCAPLSAEDQMVQSMPEASPTKWHQAHTTWFFETFVLAPHLRGYRAFHPDFHFLFNSYYKQIADDDGPAHPLRSLRGTFSRPSLAEIQDYRRHVDEHVLHLLEDAPAEVAALVELGTHHEQQHQELILTDIKHALWTHPLRPAYSEELNFCHPERGRQSEPRDPVFARFPGGIVRVGHEGPGFCFDNETPAHDVLLAPYRMAARLVTNGDYLDFIEDGGYRRPELWLSDGWDRVCGDGWRAPMYWEQRDGQWREFTLRGMQPVDAAAPVCHVSYYEADAFASWAGARLPREEEWENAEKQLSAVSYPESGTNFLESRVLHPAVEATIGPSTIDHRPSTLQGNVWQWTASAYLAYPGYRAAAGALGEYNGKFMSGQMVLRGGSCATPASHIRATYRNFFPPQARWQFMGIRLANDGD
jgi:ergothioneine biosynthesis protein EgtB